MSVNKYQAFQLQGWSPARTKRSQIIWLWVAVSTPPLILPTIPFHLIFLPFPSHLGLETSHAVGMQIPERIPLVAAKTDWRENHTARGGKNTGGAESMPSTQWARKAPLGKHGGAKTAAEMFLFYGLKAIMQSSCHGLKHPLHSVCLSYFLWLGLSAALVQNKADQSHNESVATSREETT